MHRVRYVVTANCGGRETVVVETCDYQHLLGHREHGVQGFRAQGLVTVVVDTSDHQMALGIELKSVTAPSS